VPGVQRAERSARQPWTGMPPRPDGRGDRHGESRRRRITPCGTALPGHVSSLRRPGDRGRREGRGARQVREHGGRRRGHLAAVVVGQRGESLEDRRPDDVVTHAVQVRQALDGGHPLGRDGAVDRVLEVRRQRPVHVAGDEDPAVHVLLLLGPLLRHLRDDALSHVAVELVEGDVAVLVEIRSTRADGFHQVPCEHRRRPGARQVVALEGVLRGVGGGEDGAPSALEAFERVDPLVGLGRPAGREGAAVTAVEDENLATRRTGVHGVAQGRRGQAGEQEAVRRVSDIAR
jgi:hypothetical protein